MPLPPPSDPAAHVDDAMGFRAILAPHPAAGGESDMRLVASFGFAAFATIAIVGADMAIETGTASAQGGIVCQYGTARYKRCCRESYDNNPNLGARARARDIDACMSGRERDRSEEPDRGERRSRAKDERRAAPAPADAGLRRLDCSAEGRRGSRRPLRGRPGTARRARVRQAVISLGAKARKALAVLLLLAGAGTPGSAADTGEAGVIVLVVRASSGCFSASIRVAGMLVARTEALVIPEVEGYRIVQILAREGDTVTANQALESARCGSLR